MVRRTLIRLLSHVELTKNRYTSMKRNSFSYLEDRHVQYFQQLLGPNQIITNEDELLSYNVDWLKSVSGCSKMLLKPKCTAETAAILKYCYEENLAVCPQGGNTGLVGGSVPVFDEIIISTQLMNKIVSFDPITGVMVCEAGCILENLMDFLSNDGKYIMPLDLGAKGSCNIGGNVSTNAGGLRLIRYGSLHSTVLGLQAVLANGDTLDCMNSLKKDNTGYHLKHLFIGSEGTLGLVTKVAIQCAVAPKSVNLAFIGLSDFGSVISAFRLANAHLAEILSSCEMMDRDSIRCVEKNLGLKCPIEECPFYMLIETSGSNEDHDQQKLATFLEDGMSQNVILDGLSTGEPSKMRNMWDIREKIAVALLMEGYLYKYDLSLPLQSFYELVPILTDQLRHFQNIKTVCGFGHIGDGNLHLNVTSESFDKDLLSKIEPFVYEWTSKHRGSVSAEHGIGFKKREFLKYSKTPNEIELMKRMKASMDPKGILNPYKVVP